MKKIEGICPLVAMPFDAGGAIDMGEMEGLLDYLLTTGIHGIGLYGVVSEFFKITDQERVALAELFISKVKDSDKYCLISVTDHCTEVAVERAKAYRALGADCLMVLPPHFLKPSLEQIENHLCAVAAAVDIPVMIQYTPNETGSAPKLS
jgi:4-hydroxy-tetrahydrodipicolinate synthase